MLTRSPSTCSNCSLASFATADAIPVGDRGRGRAIQLQAYIGSWGLRKIILKDLENCKFEGCLPPSPA